MGAMSMRMIQVSQRSAVTSTGWDARLYDGLRSRRIAPEASAALTSALGEVGVAAEYVLVLVDALPGAPKASHLIGDAFLRRLTGCLTRLTESAATLEVATQAFLTALESAYPGATRSQPDDVWWPSFSGYVQRGDTVEGRLRRCGYAYRHVVESRLPVHMEAIQDQLALTLFALNNLPPMGITPITTLYQGLYELSSALHGDIVPRHILGASGDPRYPGALASIARLRELDASGDTSLNADIAWARAQYAAASGKRYSAGPALAIEPPGSASVEDARLLAAHAAYEWGRTIGLLESLR